MGLTDALWLCPERALRLLFALVSFIDPVRIVAPLARVFADGIRLLRAVALAEGRLPMYRVPSEPLGLEVTPPISPYTGPGQSPQFAIRPLELRSVFHTFPVRRSASIHGDNFVSFTDLCGSQPKHSHRVVFIGHLKRQVDWVGLVSPSSLFQDSVDCADL